MAPGEYTGMRVATVQGSALSELVDDVPAPMLLLVGGAVLYKLQAELGRDNMRTLMMIYAAFFLACLAGGMVALELSQQRKPPRSDIEDVD